MTKTEFEAAYRGSRKYTVSEIRQAMTNIRKTYETAAEQVAKSVEVAKVSGASSFTVDSLQGIQEQLSAGAAAIRDSLHDEIPKRIGDISAKVSSIDEEYLIDAITDADISKLTEVKVRDMFLAVNTRVVNDLITRVYRDGYTYSERIWGIASEYQTNVKDIISAGFAQGRDPVKIAKDIQGYVADGKKRLMRRYGKLKAGTKEFMRRIPENVDYRAMRLVRSELSASMKKADVLAAQANPACLDLFDWVMQSGREDWDCACPDYAHNSPYTAAQLPVQPHPNCMCYISPHIRDRREFLDDLVAWQSGKDIDYLDQWYERYYNA